MTPLQRVIFRFREHFGPLSGLDFKLAQDAEREYFALKKLAHPEPGEAPWSRGATDAVAAELEALEPTREAPRGPEPVAWRCQHGHYASKQQDGDGVCTWQPLYATPPEAVGEACRKCRGAGYLLADTPGVKYLRLTCDACHGTGRKETT